MVSRYQSNARRIASRWVTDRGARANPVAMAVMLGAKVAVLGPAAVFLNVALLGAVAALGMLGGHP